MATYNSFTKMPLWRDAVGLAAEVYIFCEKGKLKADYRMKDQLRAAAASISNNIAEGFEYGNRNEFARFLKYAKGSAGEVFNQVTILRKADMIDELAYKKLARKSLTMGRKIGGFINYLKQLPPKKRVISSN